MDYKSIQKLKEWHAIVNDNKKYDYLLISGDMSNLVNNGPTGPNTKQDLLALKDIESMFKN